MHVRYYPITSSTTVHDGRGEYPYHMPSKTLGPNPDEHQRPVSKDKTGKGNTTQKTRPVRQSKPVAEENPTPVRERYVANGDDEILLSLIGEKSGRSRTSSKRLIASGRVSVDGQVTTRATAELTPGAVITVHSGVKPKEFSHPLLEKVWEDDDLLLVYKKAGISTVNTGHKDRTMTAIWILSRRLKSDHGSGAMLFMLNRLDKNSEGFVLFAKNIRTKETMVRGWGNYILHEVFHAVLEGQLPASTGTLLHETTDKDGKKTKRVKAEYRVLKSGPKGGMAIVELTIDGPRLYNLRSLIKANNLSIYGDTRSGSAFVTKDKIGLIQTAFAFRHPFSNEVLRFERPYPTHLGDYLKQDRGLDSESVSLTKRSDRIPSPDDENDQDERKKKRGFLRASNPEIKRKK